MPEETQQTVGFWLNEIFKPCAKSIAEEAKEAFANVVGREDTVKAFATASSGAALARSYSSKDDVYSV